MGRLRRRGSRGRRLVLDMWFEERNVFDGDDVDV